MTEAIITSEGKKIGKVTWIGDSFDRELPEFKPVKQSWQIEAETQIKIDEHAWLREKRRTMSKRAFYRFRGKYRTAKSRQKFAMKEIMTRLFFKMESDMLGRSLGLYDLP